MSFKRLIPLLFITFFPVVSTGQIVWESIYSSSPGLFGDVYFINQLEGWHTKWSTTFDGVYHTTDGGYSWEQQVATGHSCMTVFFLNDSLGWCGTHGQVGKTTDGGNSWDFYSCLVDEQIRDIVFINENEGWCVGGDIYFVPILDRYFISHTTDGGLNWEIQKSTWDDAYYLNRISYANSDTLIATGVLDTIFVTHDAGMHWFGVTPDSINKMNGIAYNDNGRFIACGHNSPPTLAKIMTSDDFGLTWQTSVLDTILSGTLADVSFVDSLNGICTGVGGSFITYDGGDSWQFIETPGVMSSVHFIEPYLAYASEVCYDIYRFVDTNISPPDTVNDLQINIESTNPILNWESIESDMFGYPIEISYYDLFRGDSPYFETSPTLYIGSTDTCFFNDQEISVISNNNVFYKVVSNR